MLGLTQYTRSERHKRHKMPPKTKIVMMYEGRVITAADIVRKSQEVHSGGEKEKIQTSITDFSQKKSIRDDIPTISQVLDEFADAQFYYKILVNRNIKVNEYGTVDALHRHHLSGFDGYTTGGYETLIIYENKKIVQLLMMNIAIENDNIDEEFAEEKEATPENIKKCFENTPFVSESGKFTIPKTFKDHINPEDPKGEDKYLDSIEVEFEFYKVMQSRKSKIDIMKYIDVVDVSLECQK